MGGQPAGMIGGCAHVAELFGKNKAVVGMVHVQALPGSPYARHPVAQIVRIAAEEARQLAEAGFDALMIENMHDRPYLRGSVGPEVVGVMTAVLAAVRRAVDLPVGVQILAAANREALAVAAMAGGAFIRAENFVFAHVADEGIMADAEAGPLLRYRRHIGAEHIRIFADVKKKHASHAITGDVSLADTARAAAFFGADGIVVTGTATGRPASVAEVREVSAAVELPVAVGSGLTPDNIVDYWEAADVFIAGSFLKRDGHWYEPLDADRVAAFARAVANLRKAGGAE